MNEARIQRIRTSTLDICYEESGKSGHCPVILLHGFPDDARAWDSIVPAVSFDNPDFVEVVLHSYRHRFGAAKGDPLLEIIENKLATQPLITVPTIAMEGACDGLDVPEQGPSDDSHLFSGPYDSRIIPLVGHFLPRESPSAVVQAILDLKTLGNRSGSIPNSD